MLKNVKKTLIQENDPDTSAKNITEFILNHTSNNSVEITSGTLIKLIEIGKNLTAEGHWDAALLANIGIMEKDIATSCSIANDYVQITSDLLLKDFAWDEMNETDQSVYATKLIESFEGIFDSHLHIRIQDSSLLK